LAHNGGLLGGGSRLRLFRIKRLSIPSGFSEQSDLFDPIPLADASSTIVALAQCRKRLVRLFDRVRESSLH
jgi:hypothetical protein